jgi:hypothetical protein
MENRAAVIFDNIEKVFYSEGVCWLAETGSIVFPS